MKQLCVRLCGGGGGETVRSPTCGAELQQVLWGEGSGWRCLCAQGLSPWCGRGTWWGTKRTCAARRQPYTVRVPVWMRRSGHDHAGCVNVSSNISSTAGAGGTTLHTEDTQYKCSQSADSSSSFYFLSFKSLCVGSLHTVCWVGGWRWVVVGAGAHSSAASVVLLVAAVVEVPVVVASEVPVLRSVLLVASVLAPCVLASARKRSTCGRRRSACGTPRGRSRGSSRRPCGACPCGPSRRRACGCPRRSGPSGPSRRSAGSGRRSTCGRSLRSACATLRTSCRLRAGTLCAGLWLL